MSQHDCSAALVVKALYRSRAALERTNGSLRAAVVREKVKWRSESYAGCIGENERALECISAALEVVAKAKGEGEP